MRFKNYINERKEIMASDSIKLIEKDCKQYLKLLGNNHPLYRGIPSILLDPNEIKKSHVMQHRLPLGTSDVAFPLINKWLEKLGHVRRDKCVIATSDQNRAWGFGRAFYMYPIGKFNYTWVESRDFNTTYGKWNIRNLEPCFIKEYEDYKEYKDTKKEYSKYLHTNTGFNKAYGNRYEIWFDCKQYYLSNIDDEVGKYFTK